MSNSIQHEDGKIFDRFETIAQIQLDVRQVVTTARSWARCQGVTRVVIVGILDASFQFVTDFCREWSRQESASEYVECDVYGVGFYSAFSYSGDMRGKSTSIEFVSEGKVNFESGVGVIVLDTVLGSGATIRGIVRDICGRNALLRVEEDFFIGTLFCNGDGSQLDSLGARFFSPNKNAGFLVGYGMDYFGRFRELLDVYIAR